MGVLRLSSALVSYKFSIQSYKLTNLSQKYAQKRVIVVGCNPFQVPMRTSPLCYENMFQVWYAWVWYLMPNACYMTIISFHNWLVEYRFYLGLSLLLKLNWNKTPKVSQQVSKWLCGRSPVLLNLFEIQTICYLKICRGFLAARKSHPYNKLSNSGKWPLSPHHYPLGFKLVHSSSRGVSLK